MNKELEALLLSAAKALDYGVVGVKPERARDWGVPVGVFCREGDRIPGHSKKARTSGYYTPYSTWRPPSGRCLYVDQVEVPSVPVFYHLVVLSEDTTGHGSLNGRHDPFTLSELKAYLRGVTDGAESMPKPRKGRR
jgi:hypothetical protein